MPIEINGADEATVGPIRAALKAAPIASPTFTGTPAAPTAAPGTDNTQIATTAYVLAAIAASGGGGGAMTFIALTDSPASYTSQEGKLVAVNGTADGLQFIDPPAAGAEAFTELNDAPASYSGQAGKFVAVNATEDGLEFGTPAGGGDLLAANNLSDLANAATARTNLGLQIGTDVQAWDSDLDAWAGKTAPAGTVVGTSDAQTLTDKTLGTGTAITLGSDAAGDLWYRDGSGVLVRLGIGSEGQVLTVASGVPSWAAGGGGGGGLANWTESVSTATPNTTVPAVSFTATDAATNVDAVLAAKGTGAILANVPDNGTAGGAKRGDYAVDWQHIRTNGTRVASGSRSVISGGSDNTASGSNSMVPGGGNNNAGGNYSMAAGFACSSTGTGAMALGYQSVASGDYAVALGRDCQATGEVSMATGYYAHTRGLFGATARSSGRFSAVGDAQRGGYTLLRQTLTDSATELTSNGSSSGANRITLPNNHAYKFRGQVIARSTGGDVKSWDISGTIKRGANAAATAIVGAVTVTVKDEDAGASTWELAVDADTTLGSLRLQATGAASTTIRWVAEITTVEVG